MRAMIFLLLCGMLVLTGCQEDNFYRQLEEEKFQLQKENQQLKEQIEKTADENKRLTKQVEVLNELPGGKRVDGLYDLKSVKVVKYTNFYDKDKDGQKEKLIVYIQPIDSDGDIIKASGSVVIELWDLEKKTNAMIGKWQIEAEQLKKMWFGGIRGANYRFVYDITDIVESFDKSLTVKVVFTDYVSGKVFNEQHLIKPK